MKTKNILKQKTESFGTRGSYHDGGIYSHWGGNDDYHSTIPENQRETEFDGKVAYGNISSSTPHLKQSKTEKAA